MHSSLDQLPVDAEGDEVFVHTHIYRTAHMSLAKAITQFEGSSIDLGIQLPCFHGPLDQL
jgi:hypothetical protein